MSIRKRINEKMHSYQLGKYRVWINRLQTYFSYPSYLMVFYLFIIESPLGLPPWVWFVLLGGSMPIISFLDITYIMPSGMNYEYNKNPFMRQVRKELKEMKKRQQTIMRHLGIEEDVINEHE